MLSATSTVTTKHGFAQKLYCSSIYFKQAPKMLLSQGRFCAFFLNATIIKNTVVSTLFFPGTAKKIK